MEIDQGLLDEAVARGEITRDQAGLLVAAAGRRGSPPTPEPAEPEPAAPTGRRLAGALALAAATVPILALAFDRLGFPGLALAATALAIAQLAAGHRRFARSGGTRGEVLLCGAALLAPLAAHGAARTLGLGHPLAGGPTTLLGWLTGPWFLVQVVAALSAGLALRAYRIPFLAAPLAASAWLAAQDAAPLLFGPAPDWAQRALLSALTGAAFLATGVAVDGRTRGDVARWLYLAGLVALTGGLVTWTGASDLSLALVALLHAGLVGLSLVLGRRSFAVAGVLGLAAATGRLADDLLETVPLQLTLVALALATLAFGALYLRHADRLAERLAARLPRALRRVVPARRG